MDDDAKELANAVNALSRWFGSQGIEGSDAVMVMGVLISSIMVLGGNGIEHAEDFGENLKVSVKKAIDTGRWT